MHPTSHHTTGIALCASNMCGAPRDSLSGSTHIWDTYRQRPLCPAAPSAKPHLGARMPLCIPQAIRTCFARCRPDGFVMFLMPYKYNIYMDRGSELICGAAEECLESKAICTYIHRCSNTYAYIRFIYNVYMNLWTPYRNCWPATITGSE